jgi:hypothetical protein
MRPTCGFQKSSERGYLQRIRSKKLVSGSMLPPFTSTALNRCMHGRYGPLLRSIPPFAKAVDIYCSRAPFRHASVYLKTARMKQHIATGKAAPIAKSWIQCANIVALWGANYVVLPRTNSVPEARKEIVPFAFKIFVVCLCFPFQMPLPLLFDETLDCSAGLHLFC